mgnify:CR=1 FL=1
MFLKDKIILSLNLASVIAGTKYRGEFEEKMKDANDNGINVVKELP